MKRPEITGVADPAERMQRIYALLFGRPATAEEISLAQQFLESNEPRRRSPVNSTPGSDSPRRC